jgi:hypothetical protein
MHIGTSPTLPQFHPAVVRAIKMPRLLPAPKLTMIHVKPVGNGVKVIHHFGEAPTKQFVFTNPKLMVSHIRKALSSEWLTPTAGAAGEARKIDRAMNL